MAHPLVIPEEVQVPLGLFLAMHGLVAGDEVEVDFETPATPRVISTDSQIRLHPELLHFGGLQSYRHLLYAAQREVVHRVDPFQTLEGAKADLKWHERQITTMLMERPEFAALKAWSHDLYAERDRDLNPDYSLLTTHPGNQGYGQLEYEQISLLRRVLGVTDPCEALTVQASTTPQGELQVQVTTAQGQVLTPKPDELQYMREEISNNILVLGDIVYPLYTSTPPYDLLSLLLERSPRNEWQSLREQLTALCLSRPLKTLTI